MEAIALIFLQWAVVVAVLVLLANLVVFGLVLKLYTEAMKERAQQQRWSAGKGGVKP